jgi:hypothetical protein
MSRTFVPVQKATLKYVTHDGEYKKLKVQAIHGVNITNSFNIPYVRGAVGLFNAIISHFMYFADVDPNKKAQEFIYMSGANGSQLINRCESQVFNIIRSLERIFDLKVNRAHETHGANTFRLSERTIEFLKIYNMAQLNEYIELYNIDEVDQYALKQVYNYRVVRPTDGNMNRQEKEQFYSFMKNRKHRDFLHYCAQNHITPESRIIEIECNIDFLSPKQREQLAHIKTLLKETPGKLKHYFHWLLIKIQQFISFKKNIDEIVSNKKEQKQTRKSSQVVNRNKTEGEQRKTEEVAAAHKKDPEDVTYQDIVEVATLWNIMAKDKSMDPIRVLTENKLESIHNLVKSHRKEQVIFTIKNTGNLYHDKDNMSSLIQFKDFVYHSTADKSRFNKVANKNTPDSRLSARETIDSSNKWFKFTSMEIPEFKSKAEAKSWFKSNNTTM